MKIIKMKPISLFSLLSIFLFWGCASKPSSPIQSNLILDINMPLFGVNDSNPPSSFKLIDTISISSTGEDLNAEKFFDGHGTPRLERALRIKAANLGANTLVDVKIEKKKFIKKSRFGADQSFEKNIMTGKAVYDSNAPSSVNTVVLDAIFHKYKNMKKPLSGAPLTSNELEGGSFWLNKKGAVVVYLKDLDIRGGEETFELIISQQEINQFKVNNSNFSYRSLPYGISLND